MISVTIAIPSENRIGVTGHRPALVLGNYDYSNDEIHGYATQAMGWLK
jgi:hypothetical protein